MSFKLSKYIFTTNPIRVNTDDASVRLLFSTRTGKVVRVSELLLTTLDRQEFDQLPDNIFNHLLELEIIVPEEEDELKYILRKNRAFQTDRHCISLLMDPSHAEQSSEGIATIKERLSGNIDKEEVKLVRLLWLLPKQFNDYPRLLWLTSEYGKLLAARNVQGRVQAIMDMTHLDWLIENEKPEAMDKLDVIVADIDSFLNLPGAEEKFRAFFSYTRQYASKCLFRLKVYCRTGGTPSFREWVPLLQQLSSGSKVEILIIPKGKKSPDFDQQMLVLLKYINQTTGFALHLLPEVSYKHLKLIDKPADAPAMPDYILNTDEILERQDYSLIDFPGNSYQRSFPTKSFQRQLADGRIPCSTCNLLPFCGGCERRLWVRKEAQCPPYKEHFAELLKIISKID